MACYHAGREQRVDPRSRSHADQTGIPQAGWVSAIALSALSTQIANVRAAAGPLGLPIGAMTFNHRARINCADFAGLLKDMKAIGVDQIELCDPWRYAGFQSLLDGKAARRVLDDAGIRAISCHVQMPVYP